MGDADPFTGTWLFSAERSKLSTPAPASWTQRIIATHDGVDVREEIVQPGGSVSLVTFQARFDGGDYPVAGSPEVDSVAYTRIDRNRIEGTGRKNGRMALRESVSVADSTLTLAYSLYNDAAEESSGVAVFVPDRWRARLGRRLGRLRRRIRLLKF